MKILLINYEYPPIGAGAATATRAIAAAMRSLGHNVTVITSAYRDLKGASDDNGVRIIRVDSRRLRPDSSNVREMASFLFRAAIASRRLVRAEPFDGIIAFFSIPGGPPALWAHMATGLPYVISLRGGDVPGAERSLALMHITLRLLRRRILKNACAVVANSDGLRMLSEKADAFAVKVVPNGVDSAFYVPSSVKKPPKNGVVRLLFVGRFQEQKNLNWLLGRIADTRRMSGRPFELHLVGDGPLRVNLKNRAEQLQLLDTVRFTGWTDRQALREIYQAADLLLNPSIYEGMPNVLVEAMACGCPVMASRVPGNETVVVEGVTGWLFDLNNSTGFSELLRRIIEDDGSRQIAGIAAREHVVKEYSWKKAAESYLEFLRLARPAFPTS